MALSPMMSQYMETKKEYEDCILFYRLGDFYEMFFDDAKTASRELELTLTGKDCGLEERAPMCGIPYHAADNYIYKLVEKGYKVAIAEQMEDPKLAKGIVKREVIKVVTPGTITSEQALSEEKNNYLCGIVFLADKFGICSVDISTGDMYVTEVDSERSLMDELHKINPSEIICNHAFEMSGVDLESIKLAHHTVISSLDNLYFSDLACIKILSEHFHVSSIEGLGLKDYPDGIIAAGAIMQYLYDTQKNNCAQIVNIIPYTSGEYMIIDTSSRRNLELVETMRDKDKRGSLLWVLDKTETAMGARLLRSYIEQPLVSKDSIVKRQDAVSELYSEYIDREELREYLAPVYDLERLMGRIISGTAGPRDLIAFKSSISMIPAIKGVLSHFKSDLLIELSNHMDPLTEICELIDKSIVEDPPLNIRDGGIIKDGFSEEVDKLRAAKTDGKSWLAKLEESERNKTGIKTMKIKFSKVFGYCFEVTNSLKDSVPDYFTRRQTLTNAERFITPELKELEDTILGAEDKLGSLEYELFTQIRMEISKQVSIIQTTAKAIAGCDVYQSLATVAAKYNYVRPEMNDKGLIDIKDGRHPVVERVIRDGSFIPNDTFLDSSKNRISIITGPNMAGKSTYMRQTALIVLMAQIGSYVPAAEAKIGICDRIFTRVGASDDLASGQSTFMVEMTEVANILRNATKNSLIILDEIGRGTSTFDGLSIAWAVVEHIADVKKIGAKTLFATHYHELTELEGTLSGVHNYCIAVKEQGEDIVFLRKIVKGGADKSYGIQVAKLAGVPEPVLVRARELVEELSSADIAYRAKEIAELGVPEKSRKPVKKQDDVEAAQLSLFDTVKDDDIIDELRDTDLSDMTPIDALNTLYKLQNKIRNRIKL